MSDNKIPTKISPDILDTIGKSFKFNHGKGIAEWLKNSLDNYLRLFESNQESLSGNWPLFVNLINTKSQSKGPNLSVVDFGGTNFQNIEKFLLYWGDKSAASLGGVSKIANLTGGHGNGGKFYMREMWRNGARFLTWLNGKVTSLIVDKSHPGYSGEWELRDQKMSWEDAMQYAFTKEDNLQGADWLINYLSENKKFIYSELESKERGFSIVIGRKAVQIHSSNDVVRGGKWNSQPLVDSIRDANQARRPLRELDISFFIDGKLKLKKLSTEEIPLDDEWTIKTIDIPASIFLNSNSLSKNNCYGKLTIKKSSQELKGRYKHRNVFIINDKKMNPIAFYTVSELPLKFFSPLQNFIFGEATINYQNADKLISNDREKLINSPTTNSLINWIAETISAHIAEYEKRQKKEGKNKELSIAEKLNKALNNHAKQFLNELETSIMVDYIEDPLGGGKGDQGEGTSRHGDGKNETRVAAV